MPSLKDAALLVKLTRHQLTTSVKDIAVSREVDNTHGSKGAGIFYKQLFKDNAKVKAVFSKQNELYAFHCKYTLPWMDGGVRILPAKFYDEYCDTIGKHKDELNQLLRDLEPHYASIVQEDQQRLGSLACAADYPSFDIVKSRFGVDVNLFPVPSSEDFRVKVGDDAKQELDRFVAEAEIRAKDEIYSRVETLLDSVIAQCSKDKPRIHESIITNLADLSRVMGILNVHDDCDIKRLSEDLKLLSEKSLFNLRNSANYRAEMVDDCNKVKQAMATPAQMTVVPAAHTTSTDLI